MRVLPLDQTDHPDFNGIVIHFTGRRGASLRARQIEEMDDWLRLQRIVLSRSLLGFEMFGVGVHAVCFTEATAEGCGWLVSSGRYSSCGIAFSKQFLFRFGGGPVFQVRGDEWDAVRSWPDRLRARAVRLWPGAVPENAEVLPHWLEHRSEWLYEREWRVPVDADGGFDFRVEDISFLVVPSVAQYRSWVREVIASDAELGRALGQLRYVVIGHGGIVAANGVASRKTSHELSTSRRDD